jgi:hypothetical protein
MVCRHFRALISLFPVRSSAARGERQAKGVQPRITSLSLPPPRPATGTGPSQPQLVARLQRGDAGWRAGQQESGKNRGQTQYCSLREIQPSRANGDHLRSGGGIGDRPRFPGFRSVLAENRNGKPWSVPNSLQFFGSVPNSLCPQFFAILLGRRNFGGSSIRFSWDRYAKESGRLFGALLHDAALLDSAVQSLNPPTTLKPRERQRSMPPARLAA